MIWTGRDYSRENEIVRHILLELAWYAMDQNIGASSCNSYVPANAHGLCITLSILKKADRCRENSRGNLPGFYQIWYMYQLNQLHLKCISMEVLISNKRNAGAFAKLAELVDHKDSATSVPGLHIYLQGCPTL